MGHISSETAIENPLAIKAKAFFERNAQDLRFMLDCIAPAIVSGEIKQTKDALPLFEQYSGRHRFAPNIVLPGARSEDESLSQEANGIRMDDVLPEELEGLSEEQLSIFFTVVLELGELVNKELAAAL